MTSTPIPILCTGELMPALVQQLTNHCFQTTVLPFIEVKPLASELIFRAVAAWKNFTGPVVLTSQQAVQALRSAWPADDPPPGWQYYAVGQRTATQIETYLGPVKGQANSATALAGLIIKTAGPGPIVFFCGDHRREELPTLLSAHNYQVKETMIYHTTLTPHFYPDPYQAILFFSPSAVQSFFKVNVLNPSAAVFSIGDTTSHELKKFTHDPVFTSSQPNKGVLVAEVIKHFSR